MPLYDYWCPCGYLEDDVLLRRHDDPHPCPTCGLPAERVVPIAHPSGIIFSNERVLPQGMGVVRSNAEARAQERKIDEMGFVEVSAQDPTFLRKRDRALEAANWQAQKLGFNDHFHRSEQVKKAQAQGKDPYAK